ncbi:adenosylcobalamin-dependent ribonucleoside-diphosphate reductase [Candidatus Cytomitobacter indipagum]|uniref:Vitamin B12-dependent ribonucleotide reductase n=1 Tax=Candidatus Cytomitobacter indipagum TaxID=2601575 RepID=A0A5C0UDH0_9PROT|nr:adenosylcobalamin-dependent ribonucleoside-diphosphate reductase [Candidatus Cytomitobacter indipagum]QEK38038.1 adenosylcobalamin-dependent ribonucleoside-diphosphate reductase [Candidatus Cytomitobacter indipagum]
MKFKRLLTKSNPYESIKFTERSSKIIDLNGNTIKSFESILVPEGWSQTSVDIIAQKYARKAGVPKFTKRVAEKNVPEWIQKSIPDEEKLGKLSEIERYDAEADSRKIFDRLAGAWTYWGWKYGYFNSEEDAKIFHDEICYMLASQSAAPNSPQWFNTGLYWAYGVTGEPQGHYFVDPETLETCKSSSAYERPQPHACFIQSVKDDLLQEGGIIDLIARETRVFKYGSGSGTNYSTLRAKSESLSSGGISSGLLSFLTVFDENAGAIKSGGTTRRSAKMDIVDANHPDIVEYIRWKSKEEDKVVFLSVGSKLINKTINNIKNACKSWAGKEDHKYDPEFNEQLGNALCEAEEKDVPYGYLNRVIKLIEQGVEVDCQILTTDFESEAYASVSGQNSNNSVRVGNDFMNKVENESGYINLIYRTNNQIAEKMEVSDLWHEISKSAWLCADPGIQYDTTINDWHTCKNSGRINASNPCSEYMFLDDTACNLASINLLKFYNHNDGKWNFEQDKFVHAVQLWTTVLEISIAMAQFPSKLIAQRSFDFRTLGLGYANLGALLMQSGMPYDSEEGRALSAYITALMHGESYNTSAKLAKDLGAFSKFDENRECMLEVVKNHKSAIFNGEFSNIGIKPIVLNWDACPIKDKSRLENLWNEVVQNGEKYGYRNAQVTLLAPTGTIGLLMDCDTLGIEPDFSLIKHKKLSGGGYFKIINNSIKPALKSLNYNDKQIKDIIGYVVGHGNLEGAPGLSNAMLKKAGCTDEMLNRISVALKNAFDIDSVFSWALNEEDLKQLKVENSKELFKKLGISKDDKLAASKFACGFGTIIGAPHIKEEHLAVFDCATHGERFISAEGHIKMMASVQPFLSGAISKTINMSENATIKECGDAYKLAWALGTKAIALYRDGSKLAQALNLTNKSASYKKKESGDSSNNTNSINSHDNQAKGFSDDSELKRGQKESLPKKRRGYTQKVTIGGYTFYHTTGENENNDIREVFTAGMGTEGASFRSLMNCLSKSISIGLQHGVPLEKYVDAFAFTKFEPYGPIQGHDRIKYATSIVDYLMRDLAISYRNMDHLAHVEVAEEEKDNDPKTDRDLKKSLGYTGDMCSNCKEFTMRRVGTCLQCESCGSTSGCS